MTVEQTIGLIGAGQMATALAAGWVRAGLIEPGRIITADPYPQALERLEKIVPGVLIAADNASVVERAEIVFLAVKPHMVAGVLGGLAKSSPSSKTLPLFVSIVAGWTIARLEQELPGSHWIRVMPNTPCLIGESASAMSCGKNVTEAEKTAVRTLLNGSGKSWELPESLMNAVTGLSGSGPAYAFQMIEALADGGVQAGLPRDIAIQLAAQTLRGAATMVLETGEHPGVLKDRVASPGGTTIAGLYEMEKHGVRGALMAAVVAATKRSQELSG